MRPLRLVTDLTTPAWKREEDGSENGAGDLDNVTVILRIEPGFRVGGWENRWLGTGCGFCFRSSTSLEGQRSSGEAPTVT